MTTSYNSNEKSDFIQVVGGRQNGLAFSNSSIIHFSIIIFLIVLFKKKKQPIWSWAYDHIDKDCIPSFYIYGYIKGIYENLL